MISYIFKKKILPWWLMQFLSDILLFLGQNLPHPKLRILIWRLRGANIKGCRYIGTNCLIGNFPWLLTIEKNTVISSGTRILTEDASYTLLGSEHYTAEVYIGENVHIGMNCFVYPGVRIGKNSVIGACSIVTKSIPANSVALGNPARVIMSVEMGKIINEKKIKASEPLED